jgi:hypothetical protein
VPIEIGQVLRNGIIGNWLFDPRPTPFPWQRQMKGRNTKFEAGTLRAAVALQPAPQSGKSKKATLMQFLHDEGRTLNNPASDLVTIKVDSATVAFLGIKVYELEREHMSFEWTCPFCDRHSILSESNSKQSDILFDIPSKSGKKFLRVYYNVCSNPECKRFTLSAYITTATGLGSTYGIGAPEQSWSLVPPSAAKVFPDYIPRPIIEDYTEACLIKDLSPKASATLSRRCLQGMIRDFWGIKKDRLIDEIKELKDRVDPLTWKAIDAVRGVGNIGAHMEKDINLIIDVDPPEAAKLIGLIELLVNDWYIARHNREERLKEVVALGEAKKAEKSPPA